MQAPENKKDFRLYSQNINEIFLQESDIEKFLSLVLSDDRGIEDHVPHVGTPDWKRHVKHYAMLMLVNRKITNKTYKHIVDRAEEICSEREPQKQENAHTQPGLIDELFKKVRSRLAPKSDVHE